jgi:hypothetical protein
MTDLRKVTYCGLYCGLCSTCNRTPKQASVLQETLRKEAVEYWGPSLPDFEEFWRFLGKLAESEAQCSCREGTCGPSFCSIRKCAPEKGIEVGPFCDGERMKEVGLDKWIEEQEKRKATGFAYVDIRNEPYDVPG